MVVGLIEAIDEVVYVLWQNVCLKMELYWTVRIVLYVSTTVRSGNAAFIITNPEQGKYLFRTSGTHLNSF